MSIICGPPSAVNSFVTQDKETATCVIELKFGDTRIGLYGLKPDHLTLIAKAAQDLLAYYEQTNP